MFFLGLSITLLCLNFAFSSTACLSETPCECVLPDKSVIDLSSVGSPEYVRFYDIPFNINCSTNELYSYNPCFPFDSPDRQTTTKKDHTPCVGASACVKSPGGVQGEFPEEHAIGLQKTAIFGVEDDIYYIDYTIPKSEKILRVELICNETSDVHELNLTVPECSTGNQIVLQLNSKCACPNGCQSSLPSQSPTGLSTGSKLLIAFFTILLAYLVIGIIWNYCNGSQGAELIPNIQFWNDLPTLIMEGIAFSCSCCISKSSYGEV